MNLLICMAVLGVFCVNTACAAEPETAKGPIFVIRTDQGDITLRLNEEKAPKTVANFRRYATEGFYKDTVFHRVIPNFMIQGGGMTADMKQKATHDAIQNEAQNGLRNTRGSIAMARTSDVDSATAQFFINVTDNPFLNNSGSKPAEFGYAVFGEVIKGMDVVDAIRKVPTGNKGGHQNVPLTPIVIKEVIEIKQ